MDFATFSLILFPLLTICIVCLIVSLLHSARQQSRRLTSTHTRTSPQEPEYYETGKDWMQHEWQIVHQIEVNKEWAMIFNQKTLIYEVFAKGRHWGECRTREEAQALIRKAAKASEAGEL